MSGWEIEYIMKSPTYQAIFENLNPAQLSAVTTIEGPVLVVAGPGTGKTQVLVARIAHILHETDTPPEAIMALTFTESAAKNMRSRLVQLIGTTGYRVGISTFHAFCSEVLATHPEYFPLARGSEALSDLEHYDFLQQSIVQLPLKRLRPVGDPFCFLPDIISSISDLKREGVSVEAFSQLSAEHVREAQAQFKVWESETAHGTKRVKNAPTKKSVFDGIKESEKLAELALVYADFQRQLRETQRFDFDDMISLVVAAFAEHEELVVEYQENIHYFLVDEYQDTNSAQDALLRQLADFWGEQANVFVVGDPNQAIFRFQGASVENMLGFVDRYPQAKVITLNQGYRCPQTLYDAAVQLIGHNQVQLASDKVVLASHIHSLNKRHATIQFFSAPNSHLEAIFVAEQIKSLIDAGIQPDKIAVLYRNNADRLEVAQALLKWQVRTVIEGGSNILLDESIAQLLTLFRAIAAVTDSRVDSALFTTLLAPWAGLDQVTVLQIARLAQQKQLSLNQVFEQPLGLFLQDKLATQLDQKAAEKIWAWYQQIITWRALDQTVVFTEWFEKVIAESGFMSFLQSRPDYAERLGMVHALYEQVKSMVQSRHDLKLRDFLGVLDTFETHNLPLLADDPHAYLDAVCLSTVHKAKGREWDYVFVIGLVDGKWGNGRDRSKVRLPDDLLPHSQQLAKDTNEDDRRLFYVAMTRAKLALWLVMPERVIKGGRVSEKLVTQFVAELGEAVETHQDATLLNNAEAHITRLLEPAPVQHLTDQDVIARQRAFFQQLVDGYVLSVTGLNTYLRSPTEFVLQNLLRVPRAKPEPMAFGTAVHHVLEAYVRTLLQAGTRPTIEESLVIFEQALRQEVLLPDALERRLVHGKEMLTAYLQQQKLDPADVIGIERSFGTSKRPVMLRDIPLSGRVDRIDWIDRERKQVVVVDYKTGHPRTSNQIAGLTKDDDLSERELALPESIRGAYKRQLLFYKLLAQQDKTFQYEVSHGRFEFIEPDRQSGKIIVREFALIDEEVAQLIELISQVMQELRSLQFLTELKL